MAASIMSAVWKGKVGLRMSHVLFTAQIKAIVKHLQRLYWMS